MKIEITTQADHSDCDCCGDNYAQGGFVMIDGVMVLDRPPAAACYDGDSFEPSELLVMALKKLGHDVFVDGQPFHVSRRDDEYHGPET